MATRPDGRENSQLRPLAIEQRVLTRSDGSVRLSQDKTVVLVSVHGPKDVPPKKELIDRATIEVLFQPSADAAAKECEVTVQNTLESVILSHLHPRTLITVVVQVINDDGAVSL
eukprot:GFYU01031604.1.p1 GENE.GFYU01031604.1~~GFYU01031604.1.p1  ORF type:complete len:114 (-),score=19.32 GFYU01031604.1:558-899(-)